MGKKIAVINDLSGFGKCSLTAAIPVISVMGVQACPMPTAVLSAQTGYPSYFCDDFTDKMENIRSEWEKMNVSFDGIYTGYVADEKQILNIFRFLDTFKKENTFLLTDPVMGDNGAVYSMYNDRLLELMKKLVCRADVVTPNLTELCLLADGDYQSLCQSKNAEEMLKDIEEMARNLVNQGPKTVLVTGIPFTDPSDGIRKIGNMAVDMKERYLSAFPYGGESYSGTGDLFASVIAAGLADKRGIKASMDLAGAFIEKAILDSSKKNIPCNDGVEFEKHLDMLLNK